MAGLYSQHLAPILGAEQSFGLHHAAGQDEVRCVDSLDAVGQGPAFVLESKAPLVQARSDVGFKLAAVSTSRLRYPPPALATFAGRRLP